MSLVGVDFSAEPGRDEQADRQARLSRFREQRKAKAARLEALEPRKAEATVTEPSMAESAADRIEPVESAPAEPRAERPSRRQRKEAIVDKARIDEHDEIRRLMSGDKDVVDELARRGAASVTKSKDRQR